MVVERKEEAEEEEEAEEDERRDTESKTKNTQRCGEKDDFFETLFKRTFERKIKSAKIEKIC